MKKPNAPAVKAPISNSPAPRTSWSGWKAVRWFAAEFLVVASGVVVALALGAKVQEGRDAAVERAYLEQLQVDLTTSELELDSLVDFHGIRRDAANRVLHFFWGSPLEPADSLLTFFAMPRSMRRYHPLMGTVRSLVSTGSTIRLTDVPLRSSMVAYIDNVEGYVDDINRYEETYFRPSVMALARNADLLLIDPFMGRDSKRFPYNDIPLDQRTNPFPMRLQEVLKDREVYAGYYTLHLAHRNISWRYSIMLEETTALRVQVDSALAR
jgi:hypothetical protein